MESLLAMSMRTPCILRILREWVVYYIGGHNMLSIVLAKEECKTKEYVY